MREIIAYIIGASAVVASLMYIGQITNESAYKAGYSECKSARMLDLIINTDLP